jgi:HSP20 family protein
MPLVPFEPFRNLDHWRSHLDKFFNDLPSAFGFQAEFGTARVDVYENDNEVIAHCEIPGLESKEDVHIHVDDNVLTIHGVINRHHEIKEEQMHRRERFTGRFQRTVTLPARVQAEGTTASYKNGILEVRMPKVKGESQKRIDVQFH